MNKVIIAGSRNIDSVDVVAEAIEKSGFYIDEVVSGTARGVDRLGESFANHYEIPIKRFPADWEKYGKQAGFIRNLKMAKYATHLIAVWDGTSNGTNHMITVAEKNNLIIFVYNLKEIGRKSREE